MSLANVDYCDICGNEIKEDQTWVSHDEYGLCHQECVDMADNGPSDNDLPDWTEPK
jgi:hypothetical protein